MLNATHAYETSQVKGIKSHVLVPTGIPKAATCLETTGHNFELRSSSTGSSGSNTEKGGSVSSVPPG